MLEDETIDEMDESEGEGSLVMLDGEVVVEEGEEGLMLLLREGFEF